MTLRLTVHNQKTIGSQSGYETVLDGGALHVHSVPGTARLGRPGISC